jgi:hypothetical protein
VLEFTGRSHALAGASGWRLECGRRREGECARQAQATATLSTRHAAKGTFIHKKRVITARCYGDVGKLACGGACDRAPSRVPDKALLPRNAMLMLVDELRMCKSNRRMKCCSATLLTILSGCLRIGDLEWQPEVLRGFMCRCEAYLPLFIYPREKATPGIP